MIAEFIGTDYSMGFRQGYQYDIDVLMRQHSHKVYISTYLSFPGGRVDCAYDTLQAFLKNWRFRVGEISI